MLQSSLSYFKMEDLARIYDTNSQMKAVVVSLLSKLPFSAMDLQALVSVGTTRCKEQEKKNGHATVYQTNDIVGDSTYYVELKDYVAVKEQRSKLRKVLEDINQKFNGTIQATIEKYKIQLEVHIQNRIEKMEQEKDHAMTEARSAKMMLKEKRIMQ